MATTATAPPGFRPRRRPGLAGHREKVGDTEGMEPGMLGLTLFVASEVMFFAGLFGAYFTFRADAAEWPPPAIEPLDIPYAAWLTVILVTSSITMQFAVVAIRRDKLMMATGWVGITLVLGVVFLGLQANEWNHLHFSVSDGVYGALFFTITGFHGLHVAGGVVAIGFLLWRMLAGAQSADNYTMTEAVSFYWHFVDVVWVGVFTTIYVLS